MPDHLKWLRVHRYRNVQPGTYLEFGPGFNVLLGRNGAGKTTLLELLDMILSRGFAELADEAFHLEYALEIAGFSGDDHVSALPGAVIEVDVNNKQTLYESDVDGASSSALERRSQPGRPASDRRSSTRFIYQVTVKTLEGGVALVVKGSPKGATLEFESHSCEVDVLGPYSGPLLWVAPAQLFSIDTEIDIDTNSNISRWAEWAAFFHDLNLTVGRFDESLGAFRLLTESDAAYNNSGIHGVGFEIQRRLDAEAKVYPMNDQACSFIPSRMRAEFSTQLRRDVRKNPVVFRASLKDFSILRAFVELTEYEDAFVTFRHHERFNDGLVETLRFRCPDFSFHLPLNGGDVRAIGLSYGEKRLLSFLWYLACSSGFVIADELVNGFHYDWITRCVELLGGSQAFLTSQNPLLLDSLPIESVEYAQRCFITFSRGPETDGKMRWSNLSTDEAVSFYRAYARETQYVHEILRGQRLW